MNIANNFSKFLNMTSNLKLFILLFLAFGLLFGTGDRAMASSCGDGNIDSPNTDGTGGPLNDGNEDCDVILPVGEDCVSQGFWGGVLDCTGACVFDTSCCFGANPCNQDPTVVITPVPPATGSAAAGDEIEYTVTVTNNDDGVCGMCVASSPRDFNLTVSSIDPDLHYTVLFASNPLTVNAGGINSTTFSISSNVTAGLGAYNFTVQAEDGEIGTGNGTFTINSVGEICDNGIPEADGDALVDCLDPDCLGHSNCCGNGTLEVGIEACDSNADCPGAQICNMHCSACIDFVPSKKCEDGFDDCDCDGICETNVLTDMNNCGMCGTVCGSVCINGSCAFVAGGLVPCGRMSDDLDTVWNEREDCKICHIVILADSITGYLLEIIGIITVLSLVIGGMLYVTSSGNSNLVTTAKTAFRKSLYGFVIVFIAWIITNTAMVLFGFDDPLGDGSWHKFDCDVSTVPSVVYICGDGIVTSPNDNGILEVCDPKELLATFVARKTATAVGCADGDGTCPDGCFSDEGVTDNDCPFAVVAWVREIYSCNHTTCDFGCVADPLVDEIGGGCYLDLNGNGLKETDECQKGRYTCNFATNTVFCENTYNDLDYKLAGERCEDIYDYCCVRFNNPATLFDATVFDGARIIYPGSTYSCSADSCDGFVDSGAGDPNYIQLSDFIGGTVEYFPGNTGYPCYEYNCDQVCKNHGGDICIGVGLGDLNVHSCYNVRCDSGASCSDHLENMTPNDCSATFKYLCTNSCWDDNIGTVNDHVFPVGSTACICK